MLATWLGRLPACLRALKQDGQGLVEYALIMVLISIVAIAVMTTVGSSINNIFQVASNALVTP